MVLFELTTKTMYIIVIVSLVIVKFCITFTIVAWIRTRPKAFISNVIDDALSTSMSTVVLFRNDSRSRMEILDEMKEVLSSQGPKDLSEIVFEDTFNIEFLKYLEDCELEIRRIDSKCGKRPAFKANNAANNSNWAAFEGFIYECLGLNRENNLFPDANAFSKVESLIQMTYSFIVGVNEYHDQESLRTKQGFLMTSITNALWDQWEEYEKKKRIEKKFIAFSMQDWLLMAFLHSLGCGKEALGSATPDNNATIFIRLYERKNRPFVRILYKDKVTDAKYVTKCVRGCSFEPKYCHLVELAMCCRYYVTSDAKKACDPGSCRLKRSLARAISSVGWRRT
ncbi:hypothetical protein NECAME_11017 [Necator americanus]|uniref:Uncharacterized protein n=1 Tax=Necator americanus TaxID=51031 RepID=W2T731_NECAM|nr:hypothetical protein NECAME_11017 [Necator americanus]ETN77444.1 hypothetical protein NECAME_11017 [Necator americanus]